MEKMLEGDTTTYLVVNTTEYNGDGRWAAQAVQFAELGDLGFDVEDMARVSQMSVSDVLANWDEAGVLVIRLS